MRKTSDLMAGGGRSWIGWGNNFGLTAGLDRIGLGLAGRFGRRWPALSFLKFPNPCSVEFPIPCPVVFPC